MKSNVIVTLGIKVISMRVFNVRCISEGKGKDFGPAFKFLYKNFLCFLFV